MTQPETNSPTPRQAMRWARQTAQAKQWPMPRHIDASATKSLGLGVRTREEVDAWGALLGFTTVDTAVSYANRERVFSADLPGWRIDVYHLNPDAMAGVLLALTEEQHHA